MEENVKKKEVLDKEEKIDKKNKKNKNEEVLEIVETKKKDNIFVKIIKELIPYVVILIAVVLIRSYLFTPIMVSGPYMRPTLEGGEIMILNKIDDIERFDVVVVDIISEDIIKRVIALPGETISCENGIVYVNGKKQEESYSMGVTNDFAKVELGEDEYFVLGDNRQDSLDSEELGPMKKEQIKGTAKLVLFPFNKIGNIE